jgi:polyphosphate kinase
MNEISNRELSWLSFNERVLMEATDLRNPLLERLKFVAIYASNMDEFFMVRVSGLREQVHAGYEEPDSSGLSPKEQLSRIYQRTRKLGLLQHTIFNQIKDELANENILFPDCSQMDDHEALEAIFLDEVLPVISPVTIDPSHPFPFIYSRRICLIVELRRDDQLHFSLITIPETLRRVYKIRQGKSIYVFTVEDIIKFGLPLLFKGYEVLHADVFRVTRDADLEAHEDSADLLASIQHSLSQRKRGDISRMEVSHDISDTSIDFLKRMMSIPHDDVDYVNGSIDLTFLFSLTELKASLMFPPLAQRPIAGVDTDQNIFEQIKAHPVCFFRPFNSFSFVSELIAQAAVDPDVLAIKMTLYRTNKNSKIIASLLEAAKRGKQVSVVVELKARFDEERNIEWAKNLEEAGCIVTYGIVGLKIHAKCMLIVRREDERIVRYTHIATGNYNEITANIYTDVDIISADQALGQDATQLFNYLMGFTEEGRWSRLRLAPFAMRQEIVQMIEAEMDFAKSGEGAIIMKMNSLIDQNIINKLYEASQAGVKIELIVRGVCGLKPGVAGLSENISVRSIVGRFLEHTRMMYFKHGGADRYYVTSADMMPRNLNGRVELLLEVQNEAIKRSFRHYLYVQLQDNCNAWILHEETYTKLVPDGDNATSSQDYFLENEI